MTSEDNANGSHARARVATLPEPPDKNAAAERRRNTRTRPFAEHEAELSELLDESPSGPVSIGAPRHPSGLHERHAPLEEGEALSKAVGTSRTMRGRTMRPSVEIERAWLRDHEAPRPSADARSGHIWPGAGRATLRDIPWMDANRIGAEEHAAAVHGTHVFRAGNWRLEAQPRRQGPTPPSARLELARRARVHMVLGPLAPTSVVLAIAYDRSDSPWLWTITPWGPSLADALGEAYFDGDERRLGDVLCIYGAALTLALRTVVEHGVSVSFGARNFVLDDEDRPRYGDVGYGDDNIARATALLGPGLAFGGAPAAVERYASLVAERFATFTTEQLYALQLLPALEAAAVGGGVALSLRSRLVSAIKELE